MGDDQLSSVKDAASQPKVEVDLKVQGGKVTPSQISHGPATARGFNYLGNVKQVVYNTRLIGEAELPRTHAELVDPRFKDKFVQPPWTSHWAIAPAVLDNLNREQWLDTVRAKWPCRHRS